ncbi:MAG: prepilin-type N-terminal cleavage/methylation domain-containing protein [Patescibacteria group bacterium]
MKSAKFFKLGFTLIELLIVIAIIGAIATFTVLAPIGSTKKARDARRMSDLRQYQAALETYANKNSGLYLGAPAVVDASSVNVCGASGLNLTGNCPEDPLNNNSTGYKYKYQSTDGTAGTATATGFVLWTKRENDTAVSYIVVCSTGRSGISTSIPAGGVCPTTLN